MSRPPGLPGPHPPQPPRNAWAWLKTVIGRRLARHLSSEPPQYITPAMLAQLDAAADCLRPGDVILVEGHSRFSTGIRVLTQSTWTHAALYVGEAALAGRAAAQGQGRTAYPPCVIEADLVDGVRAVGLDVFAGQALRICRPVSLTAGEAQRVVQHAVARLGHRYDVQHIVDLMRWLLPAPPLPARFRRRLLTLGSGDPTRAICSMLVAEALQSVRYPILPDVQRLRRVDSPELPEIESEVLHQRHASLYVPRDFDLSPYFEIVKPTLAKGFNHRQLLWADQQLDVQPWASADGPGSAGDPSSPDPGAAPGVDRPAVDTVDPADPRFRHFSDPHALSAQPHADPALRRLRARQAQDAQARARPTDDPATPNGGAAPMTPAQPGPAPKRRWWRGS